MRGQRTIPIKNLNQVQKIILLLWHTIHRQKMNIHDCHVPIGAFGDAITAVEF